MFVGDAPDYIAIIVDVRLWHFFTVVAAVVEYRNCDLVVPRTSRKIGVRAFSVAAPRAVSRLSTELKLLRSTASFIQELKSKLKSFLFHAAYTGNTLWTLECAIGLIVGDTLQVTVVTVTVTDDWGMSLLLEEVSFKAATEDVMTWCWNMASHYKGVWYWAVSLKQMSFLSFLTLSHRWN